LDRKEFAESARPSPPAGRTADEARAAEHEATNDARVRVAADGTVSDY
jgi:hypothetical protein